MNLQATDWPSLERLRGVFLDGAAGAADYWQSEQDVASYDATFAQRIGWKWDYVLAELDRRGWTPPGGRLLDWGCGSGIAARAFLDHYGAGSVRDLWLWDRSDLAMNFAARRAREKYPHLRVSTGLPPSTDRPGGFTLLLSHVLGELNPTQLDDLMSLAAQSACVLWVEPGTHAGSRALCGVREQFLGHLHDLAIAPWDHESAQGGTGWQPVNPGGTGWKPVGGGTGLQPVGPPTETGDGLETRSARSDGLETRSPGRGEFTGMRVVAPCTHQQSCGMLAPANTLHWCHHFATPPAGVFTDGDWARFAAFIGIDLRSLPLSYLVMDRRPPAPLPPGSVRVIGRRRLYKGHALLLACDGSGVSDRRLTKRALPRLFRQIRKNESASLLEMRCEGNEIIEARPVSGSPPV